MRIPFGIVRKQNAPPNAAALMLWFQQKGDNIAIMGGDVDWAVHCYELGTSRSGYHLPGYDGWDVSLKLVHVEGRDFLVIGKGLFGTLYIHREVDNLIREQLSLGIDDSDKNHNTADTSNQEPPKPLSHGSVVTTDDNVIGIKDFSSELKRVFYRCFRDSNTLKHSRMMEYEGIDMKVRTDDENADDRARIVFAQVLEMLLKCQKPSFYEMGAITGLEMSTYTRSMKCVVALSFPATTDGGGEGASKIDTFDLDVRCKYGVTPEDGHYIQCTFNAVHTNASGHLKVDDGEEETVRALTDTIMHKLTRPRWSDFKSWGRTPKST